MRGTDSDTATVRGVCLTGPQVFDSLSGRDRHLIGRKWLEERDFRIVESCGRDCVHWRLLRFNKTLLHSTPQERRPRFEAWIDNKTVDKKPHSEDLKGSLFEFYFDEDAAPTRGNMSFNEKSASKNRM